MSFAAVESWLRTRRGLLTLWLVTTAAVALVTVLMQVGGVPGWDDAAHAYKVFLLRRGGSIFWDTYWYGGGYGAITYGFVFYWLAQYVPGAVIVVAAAGTVPVSFYVYVRDLWRIDDVWPAWGMALVMTLYLAHGQAPFVLALALTLAGLALLARRHPVWAALPVTVGIFANPMGLVVVAPFVLTDLLVRQAERRRYLVFAAAIAPAVAARFLLGWSFSEPGAYLNETSQLLVYLGFALVGVGLAGMNAAHARRPFIVLFLVYAVLCVGSFVTPGSPLGNNIGRFFMVFGLPLLLLLRHTRLRRPFRYADFAIVPIVLFAGSSSARPPATTSTASSGHRPHAPTSRRRSTWPPALRPGLPLPRRGPSPALGGVVLPGSRVPITRGWYRQADAIHNGFFYTPYDARSTSRGCAAWACRYIFSPVAGPWTRSKREAGCSTARRPSSWSRSRSLAHLPCGRRGASSGPATPVARPGTGTIRKVGHLRIDSSVTKPGMYWLKFTSSPYWVLEGGAGRSLPGRIASWTSRWPQAGDYTLRFEVTPAQVLDGAPAGSASGCRLSDTRRRLAEYNPTHAAVTPLILRSSPSRSTSAAGGPLHGRHFNGAKPCSRPRTCTRV